jgi:hypothetical protein
MAPNPGKSRDAEIRGQQMVGNGAATDLLGKD